MKTEAEIRSTIALLEAYAKQDAGRLISVPIADLVATIRKRLKEAGIQLPTGRRTDIANSDIVQLFQEGNSLRSIGRKLGVSKSLVKDRLIKEELYAEN